jgi:hypothetical protein
MALSAFIEDPQELATLIPEDFSYSPEADTDEPAYSYVGERDYTSSEHIEFCRQYAADAITTGLPQPTLEELNHAYARRWRDLDSDEYAERDRLDERARIADEAVAYTSGISSHVAFDKLHAFVADLEQKSRRNFHVAELAADTWIAARCALRKDLTAWAFYQLWASGAADEIAPHILARSMLWYRVRSLVGAEIIKRRLLCGYFSKKRKGRAHGGLASQSLGGHNAR